MKFFIIGFSLSNARFIDENYDEGPADDMNQKANGLCKDFFREFHGEHVNKFIQSDATGLAAVLQPTTTTTKDHVSLLCFFCTQSLIYVLKNKRLKQFYLSDLFLQKYKRKLRTTSLRLAN